MRLAEKAIAAISRLLNNIGMVFLTLLMFVITVDVLLRFSINQPIRGANELAEFTMFVVVFLAMAYAQHLKANISIDLLYAKFPRIVQAITDIFIYLLCLGICSLILWQAFVYQKYLWELNKVSLILKAPVAPFQLVMVIGFFALCLVFLLDLIHSLRKVVNK